MSAPAARTAGSREHRLVLVGLGHVHMRLLARLADLPARIHVTIVAPHEGRHGHTVASYLGGQRAKHEPRIAVPRGVKVLKGRMIGARPIHRRLWLADGCMIGYDVLGLNTGTRRLPEFAAQNATDQPSVWSGHSVMQLIELARVLDREGRESVVIVGGTGRAWEIAGGLSADASGGWRGRITLLDPDARSDRCTRAARRLLARRGVDIVPRTQASALGPGCVHTGNGRRFAADHLIWAGGPTPSLLAQSLGLTVAGPGLQVNRRLQAPRDRRVFAAGAVATVDGRQTLDGWDAERQADVLIANINALYDGRSPGRYQPPKTDSWPLDLGREEIVAAAALGRLARRRLRAERRYWLDAQA